jgi:transposase
VTLTDEERETLRTLTKKGKASARKLARAHVLLLADEGATDETIAAALHVGTTTILRIRSRFVEEGLEAALQERPRPGAQRKLEGKAEATLVALACTEAPEGRSRWTMQLLADRLVTLEVVEAISDETVRRTLKRGTSSLGSKRSGAFRS